jgi:hypothetical protein
MANWGFMNSRGKNVIAGLLVLALVAVSAWIAHRVSTRGSQPDATGVSDDDIIAAVNDQLVPKFVLELRTCALKANTQGILLVETRAGGIWLKGWKDAPAAPLSPEQHECVLRFLAPAGSVNLGKNKVVPDGREYEVDVTFSPPGPGQY